MLISDKWKDYELIDASCGEKYERWGNFFLLRPDPQVIWDKGNLEETGFNEESYIVLTEEELSGPGTFNIKDEKSNWSVYGQFYNCELASFSFSELIVKKTKYLFNESDYLSFYEKQKTPYVLVGIENEVNDYILINFIKI